jgi:hypothetical protein
LHQRCRIPFRSAGLADELHAEKLAKPTHAVVVNLDCAAASTTTLVGPGKLEVFDATAGKWSSASAERIQLQLQPGMGKLIRCVMP